MGDLSAADIFGIIAFVAHLIAYLWYAHGIFHERIRPNAAAWFMWLVGNVIEFLTYDALAGAHWSTSALPFACVLGVTLILAATSYAQLQERRRKTGKVRYHPPERSDYVLVGFDLGAGLLWVIKGWAAFANILAVTTSIVSFWPIWRTTYHHHKEEHMGPWILWSCAYVCMFLAVLSSGIEGILWRSFYPLYYLFLHLVVVGMFFTSFRSWISSAWVRTRKTTTGTW